jgi:Mg-chelatase subunit ChlD
VTSSAVRQRLKLGVAIGIGVVFINAFASAEWTARDDRNWAGVQAYIEVNNKPHITTDDIVRVLEIKGEFSTSKELTNMIASRAYDNPHMTFSMTARDVSRLKRAGATPELIAAMKSPASVAHPTDAFVVSNGKVTLVRGGANQVASDAGGSTSGSSSQGNIELIIDASGSMAAKIGGRTKMDIAKQALTELLLSIPSASNVSVRAYGHRRKDDCADIELISNFGEPRSAVPARVKSLKPLGKTPLSNSIAAAAKDFAGREGQNNTIILITDGEETCNADPCAAAKLAHESGVKVKINVIGFKIDPKERAQLECIANAGGGKYVSANDAAELTAATQQVARVESTPPPAAPAATANPQDNNILAQANGGQVLIAPNDLWLQTNDGKEDELPNSPRAAIAVGQEGVYAFKDEQPATFDKFATLVPNTSDSNLKEFELLVADDSPTGTFRSIGKFTVQNAKLMKSPYQEFKFEPVTAKYLKIKLLSNYGGGLSIYEFKLFGQTNVKTAAAESTPTEKKTTSQNILEQANGGQVLVAPNDLWNQTNDGKEDPLPNSPRAAIAIGQEGVYAFKDERPARFDRFATLVPDTSDSNLKEFELLVGDDSPTGTFRSIGRFTVQNAKLMKSPYQEFKFEPVTAKYFKIKLLSNYGGGLSIYEFKLFGEPNATPADSGTKETARSESTSQKFAETKEAASGEKKSESTNILAQSAGGQVLVAPNDLWNQTNDGKEDALPNSPRAAIAVGQEGVYAFEDEQPAMFDRFATLVPDTSDSNLKEFELLVADDSPTGTFRSIGKFTVQNAKLMKSPYQEFKFEPVTGKYLKIKLLSSYGGGLNIYEFKLFGSVKK